MIQEAFNNLPEDWDLIKFYCSASINCKDFYENDFEHCPLYYINKLEHKYGYIFSQGNVMYALNRKAMKKYFEYVDNNFIVCDLIWYNICNSLNCYISKYKIGYVNDGSIKSNIISFNK